MAEINWTTVKDNVNSLIMWTYWVVGIVIAFAISYVLYTRFNKQVASLLVFIATMMALYYYYVKWFVIGNPLPIPTQTCPDFMESIGTVGTDQFVCVDKKGTYPTFGRTVSQVTHDIAKTAYSSSADAGGKILNGTSGYVITPSGSSQEDTTTIKTFCGELKKHGVSWINLCNYI